jgi:hypothetical protein
MVDGTGKTIKLALWTLVFGGGMGASPQGCISPPALSTRVTVCSAR